MIGKVIRLHSDSEPDRAKLYLVMDDKGYDYYSHGLVRQKTVEEWIKRGLKITFYDESPKS